VAVARVLLVEPNDHLRRVFRRRFVREGFELVEAVDGEGALGVARCGLPDIIVVEGSVRDASGLDLAVRLARDPELRGVPVIVLEGRGRWGVPVRPSGSAGAARRDTAPHDTARHVVNRDADADQVGLPESAPSSDVDGRILAPLRKELRHPFRPGWLVELTKGVIASGAEPTSGV
jgi:CheY-like chemotaxis protein